jgi:hypothetical protein
MKEMIHSRLPRKGIYQEFDAAGKVLTDERWQAVALPNGTLYIENETVRLTPFAEPRSDSVTMILDKNLRLLEFSIHGLLGKRESKICVLGEDRTEATLCWRHLGEVHERRVAWSDDTEIDYQSPLFNMVSVWRSALYPGQTRTCESWWLDPVSFEPRLIRQSYTHLGPEQRKTRFGTLQLSRYSLQFGDAPQEILFWCDDAGVLFDFRSSEGGFLLTAMDVIG